VSHLDEFAEVRKHGPVPEAPTQQPTHLSTESKWVPGSHWSPFFPAEQNDVEAEIGDDSVGHGAEHANYEYPPIYQYKLEVPDEYSKVQAHGEQMPDIQDELFPSGVVGNPEPAKTSPRHPLAGDPLLPTPLAGRDNSPTLASAKPLQPRMVNSLVHSLRRPSVDFSGPDPFAHWQNESQEQPIEASRAGHVAIGPDWHGWTVQTSNDGELFYYHEATRTSQWRTPSELLHTLGEWREVADEAGNRYWANETLNMSCWTDPRATANIFQAAYDGDMFFVQLYVAGNGNLNVVDANGCTALHYACASSSEDMAGYLIQSGARPDMQDLSRGRPLHWACRYSHSGAVKLLLAANANPDSFDAHGDTPMHVAASVNCTSALHWLIAAHANPTLRSRRHRDSTPAEVASAVGAHNAATMLVDYQQQRMWLHTPATEIDPGQCEDPDLGGSSVKALPSRAIGHPSRGSADSNLEEEALSPARMAMKAARPLIRVAQWLANRVIPTDDSRSKCWELGHGAPVLESNGLSKLISAIPRSSIENVLAREENAFEDPPGFEELEVRAHAKGFGDA
jgi:hypothetical protein